MINIGKRKYSSSLRLTNQEDDTPNTRYTNGAMQQSVEVTAAITAVTPLAIKLLLALLCFEFIAECFGIKRV